MHLPRMTLFLVCLAVSAALCAPVFAAEFSPALNDELANAASGAYVNAIVILKSPVDIRALDMVLHERRATKAERYREVITALHYNADMTQPAFRAELDEAHAAGDVVGYTAYWIENLFVIRATREYIESLRPRGDIEYATENFRAELIEPIPSENHSDPNPLDTRTVPPGITAVGALRVNEELGITGQGVLVGNCDTGVMGTHVALASRWRGNFAPWYHCWKDDLGTGTTFPNDGYGHGTHVMGTMAGRAVSGNDTIWVGCAPSARWIATNAINQGVGGGFDNDIISDYQWFANPDSNINTLDDVPDVVQNSWGVNTGLGYAQCFNYWNTVILNCEAAGVVVTWSAGNESTSGLRSPAIYSINAYQIFSVGAVDATNYSAPYPLASFSSRGPTPCTPYSPDNIKPEIAAPGVDVYSAYNSGGYTTMSGTSMAGPHIAGVVALMREACPNCDHITIKEVLMNTAIDYGTPGQDNLYGHGFVDAYNAVLAVMGNRGRVQGIIRDASTLNPLQAQVQVVGGTEQTTAGANGAYAFSLPGDSTYTLRYSLYGYYSQDIPVTVVTDDTVYQDVNLIARPVVTILTEGFESGAPGWTHAGNGTWVDDWHISTERAYEGTHSYKCGDTGTGNYRDHGDGRLVSPVINGLPADASLTFEMQIVSELSGLYPDSCYDGGLLEISSNGGAFNQINPVSGAYNKHFRLRTSGSRPYNGPMPGLACWADTVSVWAAKTFDLSAYAGQNVQLRWRFGSDSSGTREGWYVDAVAITAFGTLVDPTGLTIAIVGPDLILRWNDDINPAYKIYSDTTPEGTFSTLEGSTTTTSFTIPGGAADLLKFYLIRGWDGN